MNNTLRLKGKFQTRGAQRPGPPILPAHTTVAVDDVKALIAQLRRVQDFWTMQETTINPLIEVHYITVVAKSNRIRELLTEGRKSPNNSIVGARFETIDGYKRHVITHYVTMQSIKATLTKLEACKTILERHGGAIDADELNIFTKNGLDKSDVDVALRKTAFAQIVRDVHYVARFDIKTHAENQQERSLVTIYNTGRNTDQTVALLNSLGVNVISANMLDATTINMTPDQYRKLAKSAPYLIAMSLKDTSQLVFESASTRNEYVPDIPAPGNEPIIGVIDTRFDTTNTYFSDWVEYHDEINPELGDDPADYVHGTEVTSLIVDGPGLNPTLDDGCGRFRVRHFAVAREGRNSSFSILTAIRSIVTMNRDIIVWNLSLGSALEVPENAISPEAAILDELQNEYGVIFIVAGTNKIATDDRNKPKRVGAPADSINSLTVNATSVLREPASYTRQGPVLRFFRKPDISCFGGDDTEFMAVYKPGGIALSAGTSFAAPWVTRKMAYLIYIMNLSRETAKALLIDSASGWLPAPDDNLRLGYGIVPTHIKDVLATPSNEIRFLLEGTANAFETYNYRIPVPITNGKYHYMARATLCYFPKCDKNQGVDYTDTELDLHFGRMKTDGIDSINNNVQDDPTARTYEGDARRLYRKWDNVKHISDIEKSRFIPRITRGIPYWGFKIRKTERFNPSLDKINSAGKNTGNGMRFGIVVTLRGMDGRNHYDEFKQNCQLQEEPWIVEELDINTSIELYHEADVDIDFDDGNE